MGYCPILRQRSWAEVQVHSTVVIEWNLIFFFFSICYPGTEGCSGLHCDGPVEVKSTPGLVGFAAAAVKSIESGL